VREADREKISPRPENLRFLGVNERWLERVGREDSVEKGMRNGEVRTYLLSDPSLKGGSIPREK